MCVIAQSRPSIQRTIDAEVNVMVIWLPLLCALVGVLMYALCVNGKLVEIGRILFWTGVLAFLLTFPEHAVNLLR